MKKVILFIAAAIVSVATLQAQEITPETKTRFLPMRQRVDRNVGDNKFVLKGEYMLGGLCFCSRCGERMRANSANLRYFYYRCNCQTVLKDVAEQAVVRVFSEFMHPTPETKAKFYELVCRRVNSRTDTKSAKNANESLRKRIDKLMNALQYADEDQAEFILTQAKELKAQIVPEPKPVEVSREACDAYIDLLGNFSELPYRDQKDIIRSIVERIDIDGEKYVVSLQGMGKVLYTKGDGEA